MVFFSWWSSVLDWCKESTQVQEGSDAEAVQIVQPSSHQLRHVTQQETWDCGLACLLMVWSWLVAADHGLPSREAIDRQRTKLLYLLDTESIWTIDLVYVLDQMQRTSQKESLPTFDYVFCSNMLEANEQWKDYAYYVAAFDSDQQRTHKRLKELQQTQQRHGRMQQQSTRQPMAWVIDRIRDPYTMAILLVDNSVLEFPWVEEQQMTRQYAGHYLVVTGVVSDMARTQQCEDEKEIFLIVYNPNAGIDRVSARLLELAWQAPGTDQDVIFIQRIGNCPG